MMENIMKHWGPAKPSSLQYTLQSVRKLTLYSCILESNVNMMKIKLWRRGDDGSTQARHAPQLFTWSSTRAELHCCLHLEFV